MNIVKKYKLSWYIPIKKYREIYRNNIINEWNKLEKLSVLEIHIADHCNFSCYSCMHYSQLSEEKYYDIDIFEKDIKRMSHLTNSGIQQIRIMGGEPLLNKRCKDYLTITRKYFPFSGIILVTNGILLTKQDEDFWKSMHNNNVYLNPTKYPININIDKILELCKEYNVNINFYGEGDKDDYVKYSYCSSFDIHGKQNIEDSFKKYSPSCFHLRDGKFYICPQAAYINIFNKYFNVNLEITDKDFLDIYKCSKDDIFAYINNPIPFCKYCVRPIKVVGEWRTSKKIIDEYIYIKNI